MGHGDFLRTKSKRTQPSLYSTSLKWVAFAQLVKGEDCDIIAPSSVGQVEIDGIYVGIDKRGDPYVLPVQAKGHNDKIGIVQIEQDI